MKIFNINFGKNLLFPNGFFVDLCSSDRVRVGPDKPDFYQPAYKIAPGLYSQVIVGFVGLNATGKTTILDAICLISNILIGDHKLNENNVRTLLDKFFILSDSSLEFQVEFENESNIYKIESTIGVDSNLYYFEKEKLSITTLNLYKSNKQYSKEILREQVEKTSDYLKPDISIVSAYNNCKEKYNSNLRFVNSNIASWIGTPPNEFVKCFDSSIKNLTMYKNISSNALEVSVMFNRSNSHQANQSKKVPIESILSSGTIKGMTMLPAIIEVLKFGGYYIADELENHFNKKIIEFIMGLFTDKRTNPKGACLIFSTHYTELLDFISRKDNVYITTRDNNFLKLTRLSDSKEVVRNDISKSRIFLSNLIKGTAPKKIDLDNAKRLIATEVGGL